jgi:hypothetical protein
MTAAASSPGATSMMRDPSASATGSVVDDSGDDCVVDDPVPEDPGVEVGTVGAVVVADGPSEVVEPVVAAEVLVVDPVFDPAHAATTPATAAMARWRRKVRRLAGTVTGPKVPATGAQAFAVARSV